jgi:hypothetical protein
MTFTATSPFQNISPVDRSINNLTNVTLIWEKVPGAASYEVHWGYGQFLGDINKNLESVATVTTDSYQLSGLNKGWYSWQVVAIINNVVPIYGERWDFCVH